MRDKSIGTRIVPIVPDEARTFGMEGMFRQVGIYSSMGQLYTPQDADQLMYYREDKKGQILEEGINEGGSFCSWIAAGTAVLEPRRADDSFLYLLLDVRLPARRRFRLGWRRHAGARFPVGGTAGRTTLAGEGLQHQDGHSQLVATTIPNCRRLRPVLQLRARGDHPGWPAPHVRGAGEHLLLHHLMNENYAHPALPAGAEEGILRGMYPLSTGGKGDVACSSSARARSCARSWPRPRFCKQRFGIPADVWSVTSFSELRREAL